MLFEPSKIMQFNTNTCSLNEFCLFKYQLYSHQFYSAKLIIIRTWLFLLFYCSGNILIRMNPFIKNCRTGYHDDILNRTSHYLKLLTTKSCLNNRQDNNYLSLLSQNLKKQSNQQRIRSNLQLMKSLVQISNQTSTFAINTDRNVRKRNTLKNPFEEKEK